MCGCFGNKVTCVRRPTYVKAVSTAFSHALMKENRQKTMFLIQMAQVIGFERLLIVVKRVFSGNSETVRSPIKNGNGLPKVQGRTLQSGHAVRNVTRANSKRAKK